MPPSRGAGAASGRPARQAAREDRPRADQGTLRVVETAAAVERAEAPQELLAGAWQAAVDGLPPDWSDLYSRNSGSSERPPRNPGALLTAPAQPGQGARPERAFRFRAARRFGYGASASMVARCCARMDEAGIPGRLTILRVLSETHNVDTQGPVWRASRRRVTRDPVSWLLAEPGWPVYDADGKKLGKVDEVLGDEQTDISMACSSTARSWPSASAWAREGRSGSAGARGLHCSGRGKQGAMILRRLLWIGLYAAVTAARRSSRARSPRRSGASRPARRRRCIEEVKGDRTVDAGAEARRARNARRRQGRPRREARR